MGHVGSACTLLYVHTEKCIQPNALSYCTTCHGVTSLHDSPPKLYFTLLLLCISCSNYFVSLSWKASPPSHTGFQKPRTQPGAPAKWSSNQVLLSWLLSLSLCLSHGLSALVALAPQWITCLFLRVAV